MKIRVLSAAVYLMGGLLSLTLAVALASWIIRPSSAQEAPPPPPEAPATAEQNFIPEAGPPPAEEVPPPMPTESQQMPGDPAMTPPPPPPEPALGNAAVPALPSTAQTLNLPARDFLEPYIFDAREGRRNPFRPLSLQGEEGDAMALGPATPLERFEVEELKLLAIMWDVKSPRAMLMDPNKEIHIVGKDDRIGRKKGYIATIREGEIVIVETSEFNGEAVYSTRIMQITK